MESLKVENRLQKPTLWLMVGISGSGKTTKAKELAKQYNATIVSSDNLRLELYGDIRNQTHNAEVFNELYKRINENLANGVNVIADATNITIKSRRSLFENIKKDDCSVIACIMTKSADKCIEDDIERCYSVSEHVIKRQMMNFQIPFVEEGFDEILIFMPEQSDKLSLSELLDKMVGFDQKTKWHKYTLDKHCNLIAKNYVDRIPNTVAKLHDYGKLFTQNMGEDGNCHYFNHAEVGTYELLNHYQAFKDCGFTHNEILDILFFINYHMLPFNWKSDKAINKWKKIFGEKKFFQLVQFNKYDETDGLTSGENKI